MHPCHQALLVREFFASHNMLSLPHLPYSPDLAPADFFFLKMKIQLKGNRFHTVAKIQCESQTTTHVITKAPIEQLSLLTQQCLLAHCLIKIKGHYTCKRNPVLPSVGTLQS
jgi:transposase